MFHSFFLNLFGSSCRVRVDEIPAEKGRYDIGGILKAGSPRIGPIIVEVVILQSLRSGMLTPVNPFFLMRLLMVPWPVIASNSSHK